MGRLDDVDLALALGRREEERELRAAWQRLTQLRLTLGGLIGGQGIGPPVLVLFEGWDASGKGGAIKRLVAPLDPRHVRVVQFAAPSADEKRHHFLWRFWPALPGWGGMTVFDRTWYGRVLVERVDGLASREQWLRAYDEIIDFERSLAGLCGFNLIAFVREKKLKQLATQRVIVDYEDADRHLVEHVGKEYQRTRIVVFEAMGGRQAVH